MQDKAQASSGWLLPSADTVALSTIRTVLLTSQPNLTTPARVVFNPTALVVLTVTKTTPTKKTGKKQKRHRMRSMRSCAHLLGLADPAIKPRNSLNRRPSNSRRGSLGNGSVNALAACLLLPDAWLERLCV